MASVSQHPVGYWLNPAGAPWCPCSTAASIHVPGRSCSHPPALEKLLRTKKPQHIRVWGKKPRNDAMFHEATVQSRDWLHFKRAELLAGGLIRLQGQREDAAAELRAKGF